MDLTKIKLTPIIETLKIENIDDAIYFSEKYSGYISNSRLGLINPEQDGSAKKYFEGFAGNKIYSDALRFGSAIHMSQLQPESFELCESVDLPTAKAGFIAELVYDKMKKAGIEEFTDEIIIEAATEVDYYHGILDEKKMLDIKSKITDYIKSRLEFEKSYTGDKEIFYLSPRDRERYKGCLEALNNNKKIQELLHPEGLLEDPVSENERTILLDVKVEIEGKEPFILKLKSKLDNFTIDKENNVITVNDVKTTGKMTTVFHEAIDKFHYFREMGMYSWLLSLIAEHKYGMKNPTIKSNFLVVSTIPSKNIYYTRVVPMTRELFLKGFNEFRDLVKHVAWYTAHPEEIESECLTL